jgi:hypothetical protein
MEEVAWAGVLVYSVSLEEHVPLELVFLAVV